MESKRGGSRPIRQRLGDVSFPSTRPRWVSGQEKACAGGEGPHPGLG